MRGMRGEGRRVQGGLNYQDVFRKHRQMRHAGGAVVTRFGTSIVWIDQRDMYMQR